MQQGAARVVGVRWAAEIGAGLNEDGGQQRSGRLYRSRSIAPVYHAGGASGSASTGAGSWGGADRQCHHIGAGFDARQGGGEQSFRNRAVPGAVAPRQIADGVDLATGQVVAMMVR